MKARMMRARINVVGKPKLVDSAQPLKIRMLNQVENQLKGNGDETVNRVVENFVFVDERQNSRFAAKLGKQVHFRSFEEIVILEQTGKTSSKNS